MAEEKLESLLGRVRQEVAAENTEESLYSPVELLVRLISLHPARDLQGGLREERMLVRGESWVERNELEQPVQSD
eukprot:scaffold163253_cov31-Tisochrysis_lutea.AAC.7